MTGKLNAGRGFRPMGPLVPSPLFRARPGRAESYLEALGRDGFACFIHTQALFFMARWGQQALPSETIGRLAGRVCVDSQGEYVLIEKAVLNRVARQGDAFVNSDVPAQEKVRQELERECRALEPVGWWHTHTCGIGLFYSSTDRQNQATWSDENSIGIVLDPELETEGLRVFRGPLCAELTFPSHARRSNVLRSVRAKLNAVSQSGEPECLPAVRQEETAPVTHHATSRLSLPQGPQVATAVAICLAAAALLMATMAHIFLLLLAYDKTGMRTLMPPHSNPSVCESHNWKKEVEALPPLLWFRDNHAP